MLSEETLEEAAERNHNEQKLNTYTPYSFNDAFKEGAKWQAERMYSEDDLVRFMQFIISQESLQNTSSVSETTAMYYIEQFKKKKWLEE